ncbi:MAG: TetR/AcrR family transcriptional regulator C-terminal domain-containing protein [Methanocorpusculum sp.]|nr:TetR/AcrR family transcriptional regulator C-terminal domain-containing protein [Methanocorpusculum sp.]
MVQNTALHSDITKKMLAASLKKLMADKSLNSITVKEITDKCGLHRQTFYYHFEDVYALVRWMYQDEAINKFVLTPEKRSWEEKMLKVFEYVDKNKEVCLCTLNSVEREILKDFIKADLEEGVRGVIMEYGKIIFENKEVDGENTDYLKGYADYLTTFYTYAISGFIEGYIRGEVSGTPQEIINNLKTSVNDHVTGTRMRFALGGRN